MSGVMDFIEQYPTYGPGAALDGTPRYTIFERNTRLPCGIMVAALATTPRGLTALLQTDKRLFPSDLIVACLVRNDLMLLQEQIITAEPTDAALPHVGVSIIAGNIDNSALATVAYLQNIRLYMAVRLPTGKAHEQYRFIPVSAHKRDTGIYAAYALEGSIRDRMLEAHARNRESLDRDSDDYFGYLQDE